MPSTAVRCTVPDSVITRISCRGPTTSAPTIAPRASTRRIVSTPIVPRPLRGILGDARALAVAVLGDHEQIGGVVGHVDRDDLVALAQLHADHAARRAAHRPRLVLVEADGLAPARGQQHVVLARGQAHADQLVALADVDRDDPVGLARRVVLLEERLLDDAALRRLHEVHALAEVARGDDGAHVLALAQRQQVDHGAAAALPVALRQLVHLEPVDLADAREEQDVVVRRGDEQVLDPVVVLRVHPHHAHAPALLLAVGGGGDALDVAGLRDRDDHVLFADQLLEVELALRGQDLGAAVVAEAAAELAQLVLDDRVDARLVGEDRAQLGDERDQLAVLLAHLVLLQRGQCAQAQVEDRACLHLGEPELGHQGLARRRRRRPSCG